LFRLSRSFKNPWDESGYFQGPGQNLRDCRGQAVLKEPPFCLLICSILAFPELWFLGPLYHSCSWFLLLPFHHQVCVTAWPHCVYSILRLPITEAAFLYLCIFGVSRSWEKMNLTEIREEEVLNPQHFSSGHGALWASDGSRWYLCTGMGRRCWIWVSPGKGN
jgi:hypothetical protein